MLRRSSIAAAALAMALVLSTADPCDAQQRYVRPTDGVLLPSPSATEVDDATALSINPANLGFLQSWSLVYAGAWVNDQRHLAGQGHGIYFAFPAGPFGIGISGEFLLPPVGIRDWQGLDKRGRLSIGVSVNPLRSIGIGAVYRTFPKYDLGEKIHTLDLALTIRPINHLNFVFSFSDVNKPSITYAALPGDDYSLPSRTERAPRRFGAAITVRPFGDDRFSIGTELHYLYGTTSKFNPMLWTFEDQTTHSTDVQGMISWMITDGLTLRTRFVAEGLRSPIENSYYLDAALIVDSMRFPFGISASPYFKLSPKDFDGFEGMSWALRVSGDQPASIPLLLNPYYVAPVQIEEEMDSHEYAAFLQKLERIEGDKSVDMVLLEPEPGTLDLSEAMEINRRIGEIKEAGIPTTCYLKEADSAGYVACAAADNVWINPAGGIRLAGISTHAIHFKNLLDKIGVKADIVRIGEYKSAPETFTETEPTEPSARALNRFLDSVYDEVVGAIADGRSMESVEGARKTIESGPFIAKEALAAGLVDKIVPTDLLQKELEDHSGQIVYIDKKYGGRPLRSRTYLDSPKIAVLHIEGDLVAGESRHIPMLGIHHTGAKTVREEIRKIKENTAIKALVVRIDSPGGSVLASDIIWRELMDLRKDKPVIASLGKLAASGGYYVASAADLIYSEPTSLTGSIGVFYGKADISGLLDKVGISSSVFKRGAHSDIQSWTREYTDEERKKLASQIKEYYNLFLDRIVEGRGHGFTRKLVDKRARGRIWSGADAKHHLLVDRIGGFQDAVDYARGLGFVSKGTTIEHFPKKKRTIIDFIAKRAGMARSEQVDILTLSKEAKATLKAALPFTMADHAAPQARLPFAIIEDN